MAFDGRLTIAARIDNPTVNRLQSLLSSEVMLEAYDAGNGFVLRWGADYGVANIRKCLNSATAIKRTRKKLRMLANLRDAGVTVPMETDSLPCVARWNGGSRGSGLSFCKTTVEMEEARKDGAGAFLEWIPIKKEYRIHVFRGLVISICEKKKNRKSHKYIRSVSNGWKFCDVACLRGVDAVDLIYSAVAAVRALELDFGAVDLAMSKDNIPVVFEVNTAPGLNDDRAKLYTKHIMKWLNTFQ